MAFSVLLSLYYKEKPEYLRQSLDSVFQQTLPPNEVILVLDGVITPDLQSIVNEFISQHSELKIVPIEKNVGLGAALNEGLKHCSYEIVARMDTDDICFPNRFEKQVAFMDGHPDIDLCSSWIEEFGNDDINQVESIRKLPETHDEIVAFGKTRNPISHPASIFRKASVNLAGGYLPFNLFEDYYLWVRMIVNGCKVYNIQEPLLHFRTSPNMFNRRGGFSYAFRETRLVWKFKKLGYITLTEFIKYAVLHFPVRIAPRCIKKFIYANFIR